MLGPHLQREPTAASRIPYMAHVSASVINTTEGDYVQVLRLSGASFESADDETLNTWHERLNVTWRNIASPHVALWVHVIRRRERTAVDRTVGEGFAAALTAKYQQRLAIETLMRNDLYLSIVYRPVLAGRVFLKATELADALDACEKLRQTLIASLARYEPESLKIYLHHGRVYSELLEFLALLVNGEQQRIGLPRAPIRHVLATSRILFGTEVIEYRLPTQTRLAAMLAIKEYPTPTGVGMYNQLLSAPFSFVLTQSFSFLTKATGQGLLQRQFNRMANAGDFAVSQAEELKHALDALTSNEFVMGDHHFTLQVVAEDHLDDSVSIARTILADAGVIVAREDLALESAFWAQLPGNGRYRPRKSPITSRNFAAMSPFHNYPSGRATGNHWGDAVALLITSARSPYHFSLHANDRTDGARDIGHTCICGPTGSGKTVLIGFLVAMLARQGATQVIFDKDRGLEILVRALGGEYLPLKTGVPTGFNPLQSANTAFLKTWLRSLLGPLSTREEADLDQALRGALSLEPPARRLSRLIEFTDATRADGIHARLAPWCGDGEYGWVFDNPQDTVAARVYEGHPVFGFDVTEFLDHAMTRGPVTLYLFHLVRQMLDGRRFVCWLDEFWRLLSDPAFETFAQDGPKTWRKLNGVMALATQSASDVLQSAISRTLIEQTPTKIFFPNADANADDYRQGFGLTEREFRLIKEQLEPASRMFLVKQGHSSVVCQLDLKGFDVELAVISGRASTVDMLQGLVAEVGDDPKIWLPRFAALVTGVTP